MLGLLDVLDHELAYLAGHDLGPWVSWHLLLLHPEAFVRGDESHHRRSLPRLVRSLAVRRRVVRRDRAAESVRPVAAAPVHQQRMKEEHVAGLHLYVHPRVEVDVLEGEEAGVHVLPIRFAVPAELAAVAPGDDGKTCLLYTSPSPRDA